MTIHLDKINGFDGGNGGGGGGNTKDITIETAIVTIDKIKKNTNYDLSNTNITSITFSDVEISKQVSTIEFTTGSTAPTFTDTSGINWADGETPVFQSYQHYLIVIFNGIGFVKEIY